MLISAISPVGNYYTRVNSAARSQNKTNVSFKQKEENNGALNFMEEFNSTKVSVDPETMIKRISRTDGSGKVIKEVFVDTNDRILKMVERRDGDNVKETRFEEDGKTVREVKEFDANDESVMLKHLTYDEYNNPVIEEFNQAGILIKEHRQKRVATTSSGNYMNYDNIKLYDEVTGRIIEDKDDSVISSLKKVKNYYYNSDNRLEKTTLDTRDYFETSEYDPVDEKILVTHTHKYTTEERPESSNQRAGENTDTKYIYDDKNRLIKEMTFLSSDGTFLYGKKYNPETGKVKFDRWNLYHNNSATLYDDQGEIEMTRDRSHNRPLTTTYYDKDTHVPYREIIVEGKDYTVDRVYEPDPKLYKSSRQGIHGQKLKTRTYSHLSDYYFKQAMQRFTRENVVEVTKNYSDGEYDTYTLKVKKDPSNQDYDY